MSGSLKTEHHPSLSAVGGVLYSAATHTKEKQMAKQRVTIRKWNGDDSLSWAVFVDGRVTWNGLSRTEARYYRDQERKKLEA